MEGHIRDLFIANMYKCEEYNTSMEDVNTVNK